MNTCRICGKEIGKTYSDKKLRCSSCRKSVENAIGYNERTVEYVEDELFAWKEEYKKLKKENRNLKENIAWYEKEEDRLREENNRLKNNAMEDMRVQTKLEEENKKLREFKEKREESMFYFKAQMERAEPKTAKEAEDLQKAKEIFEKLYRKELYYLEKENKTLKDELQEWLNAVGNK